MRAIGWLLPLAIAIAGCDQPDNDASAPADNRLEASESDSGSATDAVSIARVRAVDTDGQPLAGMMPIATHGMNAFDEPEVRGELTDATGRGELHLPADRSFFVRAWDPELNRFANNVLQVPASRTGGATEEADIVMVDAAVLEATVAGPDGALLEGAPVDLMLHHPEHGAWWPSRAVTAAGGRVRFHPVPPGMYRVELEVAGVGMAEVDAVSMSPGGRGDAGFVRLVPASSTDHAR